MADIEGLSASATEMDELPKKLCHFEETPCLTRYASFCLAYHFVGSGVIEFGRTLMRQRLKFVVRFENSREAAA